MSIAGRGAQFDGAAADALTDAVDRTGFRAFHAAFGDGNRAWEQWRSEVEQLDDPLRGMVELFLLTRPVAEARVKKLLGVELFRALRRCGILRASLRSVHTGGLVLIGFRSLLLFHELSIHPEIYFGDDSIALAIYQRPIYPQPIGGGSALDLCTGCGVQAMVAARQGARVDAVEINERAAAIASINVQLNGLQRRVRVLCSSLEQYATRRPARTFDLITFNPPLLPIPPDIGMREVGHGGADGLAVTRRALSLFIPRLRPHGTIEFIGCGLGDDRGPTFLDDLSAILAAHGAQGHTQLLGRSSLVSGDGYYEALVATCAFISDIDLDASRDAFDRHFRSLGRNSIYTFFMRVERRTRARRGAARLSIVDLSASGSAHRWFV